MPVSRSQLLARTLGALPILALALGSGAPALASDGNPGVARLSLLSGEVDLRRADSGDTVPAAVNAPVSAGDYLSTQGEARAEVEFDYGSAVRVAPATQLRFSRLEPENHDLQLAAGTVELRIVRSLRAHPLVGTPQATIRPDEAGRYRVTVTNDGNTEVAIRSGRADVVTDSGTQTISAGSSVEVTGTSANPQTQAVAFAPSDQFDRWNDRRDADLARAHDLAYVDEGIVGADDLDSYGHWVDQSSYGRVWVPYQTAGWAPYHDGRWVWEPYYGWTWVAAEPWGWAPYHYGNWFYAANTGWAWYPGAYAVARPYVYRPALVAFFSFGGGAGGLSIGFGNIGWVPLAPFEPYRPWYGRGYYNRTTIVNNVTNIRNVYNTYNINNGTITKTYRNINAPGGVVAVSHTNFQRGDFARIVKVEPAQLALAKPLRGVLPVVPTRENLVLSHKPALAATTSAQQTSPLVARFAHFAPLAVAPRPFAETQTAVRALATRTYPKAAALFEKPNDLLAQPQTTLDKRGTTAVTSPLERPALMPKAQAGASNARPPSPWDRFGARPGSPGAGATRERATTSGATPAGAAAPLSNGRARNDASASYDPFARFDSRTVRSRGNLQTPAHGYGGDPRAYNGSIGNRHSFPTRATGAAQPKHVTRSLAPTHASRVPAHTARRASPTVRESRPTHATTGN